MKVSDKHIYRIIFGIILILQIGVISYQFYCKKETFHSDEIYNYGQANGYYEPFALWTVEGEKTAYPEYINASEKRDDVEVQYMKNCLQWVPGEVFRKQLSVDPEHRFAYDSVTFNMIRDITPPFYFYVLHTACSFFPGVFSWSIGFGLNIIFFAIMQLFIYLCSRELTGSKVVALITMGFWGFTIGAQGIVVFIRHYCLMTTCCVGFCYFAIRIHKGIMDKEPKKEMLKRYACMLIAAFLAVSTQYFAAFFLGSFTALYCLYLLLKGKWKHMLVFGLSMTACVGIFLLVWPYVFEDMGWTGGNGGYTRFFSALVQFKMYLRYFCKYCLGFSIPVLGVSYYKIIAPLVPAFIILTALVLFPFRHEDWCIKFISTLKKLPKRALRRIRKSDFVPLIVLLAGLSVCIFVSYNTNVNTMGEYAMRYIMIALPILLIGCVAIVYLMCRSLLNKRKKRKRIAYIVLTMLAVGALLSSHIQYSNPFVSQNVGNYENENIFKDKNVVFIAHNFENTYNACSPFLNYANKAKNVFITNGEILELQVDQIRDLKEPIDYVVIYWSQIALEGDNKILSEQYIEEFCNMDHTSNSIYGSVYGEELYIDSIIEKMKNPEQDCSKYISQFSNNARWKLVFGMNNQTGLFYVLERQ